MDTLRVDIVYRPLRMAWAVHSGNWPSFESAIRISHIARGGRFNPVVFVDRAAEAKQLVEAFRADLIWPVGDREDVKAFPANYPHLINPLYGDLFHRGGDEPGRSQLLDIHNAASHGFGTPQWKHIEEEGVRVGCRRPSRQGAPSPVWWIPKSSGDWHRLSQATGRRQTPSGRAHQSRRPHPGGRA